MPANAPHGTTSEYSTCSAEAISRIKLVKRYISNHVILVIRLGESFYKPIARLVIGLGKSLYEFVATVKPFGLSSKVIVIAIVLVCRK